jgi:hypothetical protein
VIVPSSLMTAVPLGGSETETSVSGSPLGSVSLSSTGMVMPSSAGVCAVSSPAIGSCSSMGVTFSGSTVTSTVAVSKPPVPSLTV